MVSEITDFVQPTTIGRLLHFASRGDVRAVEKVLNDFPGLSVDSQDYDGRTAMHLAASEGKSEVIKLLLAKGANVNPVDRWRKTPLADARRYEAVFAKTNKREIYREVCDLLVNNGGSTSSPFEIDPAELKYLRDPSDHSEFNLGKIRLANWRGTNVQARIMDRRLMDRSGEISSPKSSPKSLTKQLSLLQRLRHPNIVQFLGAVQTKSEPLVLVTEYLPKGNLLELLRESKKGRIRQKEAINYALDIARGMNYLHRHNPEVVHCDLNPKNLLRDAGGHLKVAGLHLSEIAFICKFGHDPSNQSELVRFRGSDFARYRAPELHKCSTMTPDKSADVYSFGVIVREMFEGWSLAIRSSSLAIKTSSLASKQAQGPKASREAQEAAACRLCPLKLQKYLAKCCHPDPGKRPVFEKIIEELERIHEEMLKRPLCGAMKTVASNIGRRWTFCIADVSSTHVNYKSRSSMIHSIESQRGVVLDPNGEADPLTCTPIPE